MKKQFVAKNLPCVPPALSNKGDKKRRSLLGDTSFALVFQLKHTEEVKVTQPPLKARLCRSY